jgi:hypothetical protein
MKYRPINVAPMRQRLKSFFNVDNAGNVSKWGRVEYFERVYETQPAFPVASTHNFCIFIWKGEVFCEFTSESIWKELL